MKCDIFSLRVVHQICQHYSFTLPFIMKVNILDFNTNYFFEYLNIKHHIICKKEKVEQKEVFSEESEDDLVQIAIDLEIQGEKVKQ